MPKHKKNSEKNSVDKVDGSNSVSNKTDTELFGCKDTVSHDGSKSNAVTHNACDKNEQLNENLNANLSESSTDETNRSDAAVKTRHIAVIEKNIKNEKQNDAQGERVNKKGIKSKLIRSVRLRTWFAFILLAIIIVALFWTIYFTIILTSYESMRKNSFRASCDDLVHTVRLSLQLDPASKGEIESFARQNKAYVGIFTPIIDEDENASFDFDAIIFCDTLGSWSSGSQSTQPEYNAYFYEILTTSYVENLTMNGTLTKTRINDELCFVYGCRTKMWSGVAGSEPGIAYYCIIMPFKNTDATANEIMNIMIICTVIVILLSMLIAIIISRSVSRPIVKMSADASRLAEGDFSVQFDGDGLEEYDNLADALNKAKDEMEHTETMRSELIANISHDLRTPLTMVKAYGECLRDLPYKTDKKRKEHAQIIIDEADRLTSLVSDVLNFSKLRSGVYVPELAAFDIKPIMKETCERFVYLREKGGYTFDIQYVNATVECDNKLTGQVLYNFIANAVNYSGEDKVVIVRAIDKGDVVRIEVSDHGKGIAPDELNNVWERYYRANQKKRGVVGTGLGLSICKSILTAQQNNYGVDSEIGVGTTFWFELKKV